MKLLLSILAALLLQNCSSTPGAPSAAGAGPRGRHSKREQKSESTATAPGYAHSLTDTIRGQIANCQSGTPDEKICRFPDLWLYPLRTVKFALLSAQLVDAYPQGGTGPLFANELSRGGFRQLHPKNEEQIPPGAIVVYDGPKDFAEIKGDDGFYYSNQARVGSAFDHKIEVVDSADRDDDQVLNLKKASLEFTAFSVWVKH